MECSEPEREDGICMYQYLQHLAGIRVSAKKAGEVWDKMTVLERQQVAQMHDQYMDEDD